MSRVFDARRYVWRGPETKIDFGPFQLVSGISGFFRNCGCGGRGRAPKMAWKARFSGSGSPRGPRRSSGRKIDFRQCWPAGDHGGTWRVPGPVSGVVPTGPL